jgi:hypothetical protein
MGDNDKKKEVKVIRPAAPSVGTVFDWHEVWLRRQGAAAGIVAQNAEHVFFLPEFDSSIPIKEGPTAATSWEGYHAGKHGVFERFQNLKDVNGPKVNMGQLFFNEKFRWIRPQFLTDPNTLKFITEAECEAVMKAFFEKPSIDLFNLQGIFDSAKFTQDITTMAKVKMADPKTTIWQGRYVIVPKDERGNPTGPPRLDRLQTNVDFQAFGQKWRLALDAETGRALNFFKIDDPLPPTDPNFRPPMKFAEIVIKWQGKITDVTAHQAPGSSITIEKSATWEGLIKGGIKSGAISGGLAAAFLGAIDGFKKEGIPGALKGLAIGAVAGAVGGAVFGGVQSLVVRLLPQLGNVLKIAGFVATVFFILIDPSDIAPDPQEFRTRKRDQDGNLWLFRNIEKKGTFFPKFIPHGVRIITPQNVTMEFGDEEFPGESSFSSTPITRIAALRPNKVKWHMMRTPDGASMWWWQDLVTTEEFMTTFESDDAMKHTLDNTRKEQPFRFIRTQN